MTMTTFERYAAIAAMRLNDAVEQWDRGGDDRAAFQAAEDAIAAIRFAIDQTKIEAGLGHTEEAYAQALDWALVDFMEKYD